MITESELKEALDQAYKQAGHNAYFGNGFNAGVKFALSKINKSLSKINKIPELEVTVKCSHPYNSIKTN